MKFPIYICIETITSISIHLWQHVAFNILMQKCTIIIALLSAPLRVCMFVCVPLKLHGLHRFSVDGIWKCIANLIFIYI